jgi:pimeloyl-ACP methyl ester carboxylesterase
VETVRSADGTTIAFERSGEGPPLILVGGALSDRSAAANLTAHLAPAHLTVVAFDRRGRGDSSDTPPYAVEREIEDVAALLGSAGGSAGVFGHSSGAVLALRAAEAGLPITRLAVYEPPFIVDDARGEAVEYFMRMGVQVPDDLITQMRAAPMWPAMEALAHTLAYDGEIMGDTMAGSPERLERWGSLEVPVLVIDGGASPAWMRNSARTLSEILPNASYTTLAGQDHGPSASVLGPVLTAFFGRDA